MKITRIPRSRVHARGKERIRACTYAVSAACYTEVLYRLTVGNRRERRRKACQGLRRGFGFPILLIFLFLPPFRFLALPFCLSLSRRSTPGGCLPLLPLVSPLGHPPAPVGELCLPSELCLLFRSDLPYTRPSSQSGVAGSFRASKRIKSYGRGERLDLSARSSAVPSLTRYTFRSLVGPYVCAALRRTAYHSGTIRKSSFLRVACN